MYLKKVLCSTIDKNSFNNDGIYDLSFDNPDELMMVAIVFWHFNGFFEHGALLIMIPTRIFKFFYIFRVCMIDQQKFVNRHKF